jgi:hypothetical protein
MGPTTLLRLSPEDRNSVERWHRREWEQFLAEVKAYKVRVLENARGGYMRAWEKAQKCEKCRRRRRAIMLAVQAFKGPRSQRGSILLSAFQGAGGSGDCSFTASTIPNLSQFAIEPTDAYTQARLHTDGDWYYNDSTNGAWGASRGTWDGDCALNDYDSRWNKISGSNSNWQTVGSDGVWSAAGTTGASVGYTRNFGILSGSWNVELRDGTTLNVLFTDSFTMYAEVDARN